MGKVACYTPDGEMKMKEPVDARECVANCGFTMEAPEVKMDKIVEDEIIPAINRAAERDVKIEIPAQKVDGRRKKRNK